MNSIIWVGLTLGVYFTLGPVAGIFCGIATAFVVLDDLSNFFSEPRREREAEKFRKAMDAERKLVAWYKDRSRGVNVSEEDERYWRRERDRLRDDL
jgi:hypothetical protein